MTNDIQQTKEIREIILSAEFGFGTRTAVEKFLAQCSEQTAENTRLASKNELLQRKLDRAMECVKVERPRFAKEIEEMV